jgi:hypothetical protein
MDIPTTNNCEFLPAIEVGAVVPTEMGGDLPSQQIIDHAESIGSLEIPAPESDAKNLSQGRWQKFKKIGLTAFVGAELLPLTNEAPRFGIYVITEVATRNPYFAGGAFGASTLAIELAGGLATSHLLASDKERADTMLEKINEKGKKLHLPMEKDLSKLSKTWWTLWGGLPLGLLLEQREDPSRTEAENRRHSYFTSAWQGGALAVVGYAGAKGVNFGLEDPLRMAALGGAGATVLGGRLIVKKAVNTVKNKFRGTESQHNENVAG